MCFIVRRFTLFFAEIELLPKLYQNNCFLILFENLFKPRQRRLAVCMVTDFVSSIHNLKTMF